MKPNTSFLVRKSARLAVQANLLMFVPEPNWLLHFALTLARSELRFLTKAQPRQLALPLPFLRPEPLRRFPLPELLRRCLLPEPQLLGPLHRALPPLSLLLKVSPTHPPEPQRRQVLPPPFQQLFLSTALFPRLPQGLPELH